MCLVAFSRNSVYSALRKLEAREPDQPRWAYVVVCDDCSHRCGWCYGEFNQDLHHHMPVADFRTVLEKLKQLGIVQVTLAGGEPTEHPRFRELVRIADEMGYLIHIASHGEHIDADLARFLGTHRVRQVQMNFQGRRWHDRIHGVPGAYERLREAAKHLVEAGVEVTATVTAGRYNLQALEEIFAEAAELGVDRLRVWETTGHGNPWLKGLEAREIFEAGRQAAARLGYTHVLSYDPVYKGDVSVACLQFDNVFLYITSHGVVRFCGAVVGGKELEIVDCLTAEPDEILRAYLEYNRRFQGDQPGWCPAREGWRGQGPDKSEDLVQLGEAAAGD